MKFCLPPPPVKNETLCVLYLEIVELVPEPLVPLTPKQINTLCVLYLEIVELVPEPPVPLPGHHPDVAPLVPESLGPRVLDPALLAHAGTASTWGNWKLSNDMGNF